jgi:hypothetical protein
LLSLIAAYGGLPLDYRTTPVTINFTDPANVDAIQQVLDLAKDGYIEYTELFIFGGGRFNFGSNEDTAIYSQLLNGFNFFGGNTDDYRLSPFPQGFQYSALAYDIGAAYISAQTSAIEACYRWISAVSHNPNLFDESMPATRSMLNSNEVLNAQGADAVAFYTDMDGILQRPDAVTIPTLFSVASDLTTVGDFLVTVWLTRAFDNYVLHDADLVQELEEAQLLATSYQDCIVDIPPFDPAVDDSQAYSAKFIDCATLVDPTFETLFGGGRN